MPLALGFTVQPLVCATGVYSSTISVCRWGLQFKNEMKQSLAEVGTEVAIANVTLDVMVVLIGQKSRLPGLVMPRHNMCHDN